MKEVLKICALFILMGLSPVFGEWNASTFCSIQVYDGHYLTAVGGGGRTTNVFHTDATRVGTWETFRVTALGGAPPLEGFYVGIQTYSGHYLSAQGGGGRAIDPIHSNRTQLLDWEKFKLIPLTDGWYSIETIGRHFLTAVGGGGRTAGSVIAAQFHYAVVPKYGMFKFSCRPA